MAAFQQTPVTPPPPFILLGDRPQNFPIPFLRISRSLPPQIRPPSRMAIRFYPAAYYNAGIINPSDIEIHDNANGYVHLSCDPTTDGGAYNDSSIVIALDGACPYNGQQGARGAFGVYVGAPGTAAGGRWNESRLMHSEPTSHRAELVAATCAVTLAQRIFRKRKAMRVMVVL